MLQLWNTQLFFYFTLGGTLKTKNEWYNEEIGRGILCAMGQQNALTETHVLVTEEIVP